MTQPVADVDFFTVVASPEFREDPYEYFDGLRELAPVLRTEFGVYLLSRLVAEDAAVWDVIEARMNELFPYALGVVSETFEAYEDGVTPFGLEQSTFVDYASSQFAKRYERISRARGRSLAEIDALADADA